MDFQDWNCVLFVFKCYSMYYIITITCTIFTTRLWVIIPLLDLLMYTIQLCTALYCTVLLLWYCITDSFNCVLMSACLSALRGLCMWSQHVIWCAHSCVLVERQVHVWLDVMFPWSSNSQPPRLYSPNWDITWEQSRLEAQDSLICSHVEYQIQEIGRYNLSPEVCFFH